jgi:hypothetical protein
VQEAMLAASERWAASGARQLAGLAGHRRIPTNGGRLVRGLRRRRRLAILEHRTRRLSKVDRGRLSMKECSSLSSMGGRVRGSAATNSRRSCSAASTLVNSSRSARSTARAVGRSIEYRAASSRATAAFATSGCVPRVGAPPDHATRTRARSVNRPRSPRRSPDRRAPPQGPRLRGPSPRPGTASAGFRIASPWSPEPRRRSGARIRRRPRSPGADPDSTPPPQQCRRSSASHPTTRRRSTTCTRGGNPVTRSGDRSVVGAVPVHPRPT